MSDEGIQAIAALAAIVAIGAICVGIAMMIARFFKRLGRIVAAGEQWRIVVMTAGIVFALYLLENASIHGFTSKGDEWRIGACIASAAVAIWAFVKPVPSKSSTEPPGPRGDTQESGTERAVTVTHGLGPEKVGARDDNRPPIAKALLWVLAGILLSGYVAFMSVRTYQVMRGGGQARARVIELVDEVREADDGRRAGIVTVAVYQFTARGQQWRGTTEMGTWSEGDMLDVQFSPSDPSWNRAVGDREPIANLLLVTAVAGLCAFYALRTNLPVLLTRWRGER